MDNTNKIIALITGASGQCGLYMIEYLLTKPMYQIHALVRRSSRNRRELELIAQNYPARVIIQEGDITEEEYVKKLIQKLQPDEIYNYAAQSHVQSSENLPNITLLTNYQGFINLCKGVISAELQKKCKILQCSTSEMYGNTIQDKDIEYLDESDPFKPCSNYGESKLRAYQASVLYRETHNIQVYNSISFNHESPRRSWDFVTRKITTAVARIKLGRQQTLVLGNVQAKRDWSHAQDVVRAQWLILNKTNRGADDYVVASGNSFSIKQFVNETLKTAGFSDYTWVGQQLQTKCLDSNGRALVTISQQFYRQNDIENLVGNSQKLHDITGWVPEVSFKELVREMYEHDLQEESFNIFRISTKKKFQLDMCKKLQCYEEPKKRVDQEWEIKVAEPYITQESAEDVITAVQRLEISSKCDQTQTFEKNLRKVFKVPSSISCSNGYSALVLALKTARIGHGVFVLIPSGTMVAVINAVIDVGAIPILVDNSDKYSLNPTVEEYKKEFLKSPYIQMNTKGLIVTHTYGVPAELDEIVNFAKMNQIVLIEDIAEAVGTIYKGQLVGTFGDFATASLYANKILTSGDGGFVISKHVVFNNENVQSLFQTFTNHGFTDKYHFLHNEQTGNYRISGLSAAFAMRLPNQLAIFTKQREEIDAWYRLHLKGNECHFEMPSFNKHGPSTPWVFPIIIIKNTAAQSAKDIRSYLCDYLIETRSFFYPIHQQPFYRQRYGYILTQELPNCDYQYEYGLYLPCYHSLTENDVIYICKVVNSYFSNREPPREKKLNQILENEIDDFQVPSISQQNVEKAILLKASQIISREIILTHNRKSFEPELEQINTLFLEDLCNKYFRHEKLLLGSAILKLCYHFFTEESNMPEQIQDFIEQFEYYQMQERSIIQRNARQINFDKIKLSENLKRIPTSTSEGTVKFVKWLAMSQFICTNQLFLDVGCLFGKASAAFAEGLEARPDYHTVEIFSIDNFVTREWLYQKNQTLHLTEENRLTLRNEPNFMNFMKKQISFIKRTAINPVEHQFLQNNLEDQLLFSQLFGQKQIGVLFFDLNFNEQQLQTFFEFCSPCFGSQTFIIFNQFGNIGAYGLRRYLYHNRANFEIYLKLDSGARIYKYIKNMYDTEKSSLQEEVEETKTSQYSQMSPNNVRHDKYNTSLKNQNNVLCQAEPILDGISKIQRIFKLQNQIKLQVESIFKGIRILNNVSETVIIKKKKYHTDKGEQNFNNFSIIKDKQSKEYFIVEPEIRQEKLGNFEEIEDLSNPQATNLIKKLIDHHSLQQSEVFNLKEYFEGIISNIQDGYHPNQNDEIKDLTQKFVIQILKLIKKKATKVFQGERHILVHGQLKPSKILIGEDFVELFDYEHSHLNFASYDFVFIALTKPYQISLNLKKAYCQQTLRDPDIFNQQVSVLCVLNIIKDLIKMSDKELSISVRDEILRSASHIVMFMTLDLHQCAIQQGQIEFFAIYEKLSNCLFSRISSTFDKKFYVHEFKSFDKNQGWVYATELIQKHLHSIKSKIVFIPAIEDFIREQKEDKLCFDRWCGILHQVPSTESQIINNVFSDNRKLMQNAESFYTLTTNIFNHAQKYSQPNQFVQTITYCATPPTSQFNIASYLCSKPKQVVQIGEYLRDTDFFLRLSVPYGFKKIIQSPSKFDSEIINQSKNQDQSQITNYNKGYLSNEDYEKFLTSSIVCMRLQDAGACTVVVECISRNIPIIINYLEPLAEYLGNDYPLFFRELTEINELLTDASIIKGYEYLTKMKKGKFFGESFLKQITSSGFYRTLKLPQGASMHKEFQTLPLTVLLNSFKRVQNIPIILQCLSEQKNNDSKQLQVIIWNNNDAEYQLLQLFVQQYQDNFFRLEVITSSHNYYCLSRSSVCHLALGKLFLIVDDDIKPGQDFLYHMISSYKRLRKQRSKKNIVVALRGNIFKEVNCDLRENLILPDEFQFAYFLNQFENKMFFVNQGAEEQDIHLVHADVMLLPTSLMKQVASQQMPQHDFALVDDYWYSFVAAYYFGAALVKIEGQNQIEVLPDAEDATICLHTSYNVLNAKISLYQYHMKLGWPFKKKNSSGLTNTDLIQKPISNNQLRLVEFIQNIDPIFDNSLNDQQKLNTWHNSFFGANSQLDLNNKSLQDALNYGINVLRVGATNTGAEFPIFIEESNLRFDINRQKIAAIERQVQRMLRFNIKLIITIHNFPQKDSQNKLSEKSFWKSEKMKEEFANFWQQLALILSRYPNIIGYDLVNEPMPDSTTDLISFYDMAIKAIRKVDTNTPIILAIQDGEELDQINHLQKYKQDNSLIFSFHFYQPRRFTQNKDTYQNLQYPGMIPEECNPKKKYMKNMIEWDIDMMRSKFKPILAFMKDYDIAPYRIFVGEYGVRRDAKDSVKYMKDIVTIIQENNFPSCFYAFREQYWNAMDYECGLVLRDTKRRPPPNYFSHILFNQSPLQNMEIIPQSMQTILEDERSNVNNNQLEPWKLNYCPSAFALRGEEVKGRIRKVIFDIASQQQEWQPLFVVGCSRSGTTLMLQLLSQYDSVFALNEPREIWFNALPQLDIWSEYALFRQGKLFFSDDDVEAIPEGQIVHLRELFAAMITQANNSFLNECVTTPIMAEKTPENLFRIRLLKRIFPKCKFIVTNRKREDVVTSILSFDQEDWYGNQQYKLSQLKSFLSLTSRPSEKLMNNSPQLTLSDFQLYSNAEIEYEASLIALDDVLKNDTLKQQMIVIKYEDLLEPKKRELALQQIEEFLNLPRCDQRPRIWSSAHIDSRHRSQNPSHKPY